MKIVVTGAGGFVGSSLVQGLVDRGHEVIALGKIAEHKPGVTTVPAGDMTVNNGWIDLLQGADCVVHLAGYAHDLEANDDYLVDKYQKINVDLTMRLAREAAKHGVRRFVFISSVKVMGESSPGDEPLDETAPMAPVGPYACSKATAEKQLAMVAKETSLELVILRPPLVYGCGAKANMAKMVKMVAQHRLIPVPANGGKRSFIYVGNLADAIGVAVEDKRAGGKTYLVSDGDSKTMEEMIHLLAEGADRRVITVPVPEILMKLVAVTGDCFYNLTGRLIGFNSDVYHKINAPLQVTTNKIRNQLQWNPPYSMELACIKTMAPFRPAGTEKTSGHSAIAEVLPAPLLPGAPAATVIIVNYNGGELLTECIRSVLASSVQVQVIVSDNASTDGSLEYLERAFGADDRLLVIRNKNNLGFARGNNVVVPHATGRYLLFLNPDCIIEPDVVERMIELIQSTPGAGMAGCLIRNLDGSEQVGCRRMVPTPWRTLTRVLHLNTLFPHHPLFRSFVLANTPLPTAPASIEALSGAFMFVTREAFAKVGPLDENYFMHCEDLDWCMRFRAVGYSIIFAPDVEITHIKGNCSVNSANKVLWHKHIGMIRFYRKFFRHQYPFPIMQIVIVSIWLRFAIIMLISLLKKGFQKQKTGVLR